MSRENKRIGRHEHKRGREFSHVAYALQTIENMLIEIAVRFFQTDLKHRVDVLMFDGFMIRRTESRPSVTEEEI